MPSLALVVSQLLSRGTLEQRYLLRHEIEAKPKDTTACCHHSFAQIY
jgi:hypothetical protein